MPLSARECHYRRMATPSRASATTTRRIFDLGDVDARTANRLISGLVVPRPIGWIGSISATGVHNLAPFSFYNAVSTRPPLVMFSTSLRGGEPKDTLANVRDVPEFTVNLATDRLAHAVNATSAELPHGEDEFEYAGLTPEYSGTCRAPGVTESPAVMECVVDRVVDLTDANPIDGYVMTIGAVRRIRLSDELSNEVGRVDQARVGAIARMGGPTYARTTDLFPMERP